MIRAFAAIPLPEAVTDLLEEAQDDLPAGRPILPENMHLTLVFLGDLRPPDLDEVHRAFEAVRVPDFNVAIRGLGAFGARAPRSVHAVVADEPALRHLQAKLAQAARGAGVEVPARRYVPHVTIARLKGRREDFRARRRLCRPPLADRAAAVRGRRVLPLPLAPAPRRRRLRGAGSLPAGLSPRNGDRQTEGVPPSSTVRIQPVSMLPPPRITATSRPAIRSRSAISAASGAAPAPSARLWVSVK